MNYYTLTPTPWGVFGYVIRGNRLAATFLPRRSGEIVRMIRRQWPDATEDPDRLPDFARQVSDYFDGKPVTFSVDLDLTGITAFRRSVLKACRRIPYGKTASYFDLARTVGNPRASRAVGGAMAHNPIPLVVPCHRVLRSDGSLGGFSTEQGTAQKQRLLLLEAGGVSATSLTSATATSIPRELREAATRRRPHAAAV